MTNKIISLMSRVLLSRWLRYHLALQMLFGRIFRKKNKILRSVSIFFTQLSLEAVNKYMRQLAILYALELLDKSINEIS